MNKQTLIQRELVALLFAVALMALKVVLMLTLLRSWKVRNEPDV